MKDNLMNVCWISCCTYLKEFDHDFVIDLGEFLAIRRQASIISHVSETCELVQENKQSSIDLAWIAIR